MEAGLTLTLAISHPASAAEASWLAPSSGQQQQQQQRARGKRGKGRWGGKGARQGGGGGGGASSETAAAGAAGEGGGAPEELLASESLARRLESMVQAAFLEACPSSAAQLAAPAEGAGPLVRLSCQRKPVYVGGR